MKDKFITSELEIRYDSELLEFYHPQANSAVYLEVKNIHSLRLWIDKLDDSFNSNSSLDTDDDWLPEDIYGNNQVP